MYKYVPKLTLVKSPITCMLMHLDEFNFEEKVTFTLRGQQSILTCITSSDKCYMGLCWMMFYFYELLKDFDIPGETECSKKSSIGWTMISSYIPLPIILCFHKSLMFMWEERSMIMHCGYVQVLAKKLIAYHVSYWGQMTKSNIKISLN